MKKNPVHEVGQVDIAVEQCDDILHGLANHRDKTISLRRHQLLVGQRCRSHASHSCKVFSPSL